MLIPALVASLSAVLAQEAVPPSKAQQPPAAPPPMQWFTRLGSRALDVELRLGVVDRVVLVPDEATYLDELSKWTRKDRWPVLFEDDADAARFIRAFRPSQVVRRASVGAAPAPAALPAACDAVVARAWGGDPAAGSVKALQAASIVPPGLVVASASDPAWTAAVAFAAGRGQPLLWIDAGAGGGPDDVMPTDSFRALDAAVRNAFATSGLSYAALGDDLDALTLCRALPVRVDLPAPPGGRNPQLPKDLAPLSLTDSLCRNDDGSRYAFAAQVLGDRARSAYVAMCSLFLRRVDAWMFDGYAQRQGGMFPAYGFGDVSPFLSQAGFRTRAWQGADGTMSAWRSILPKGVDADLLLVNSSGNADFFEMEPKSRGWSTDIPVLRRPVMLSMVHSFSLQTPAAAWTVGGRWLDHGAYAYVGSVHEPFLTAFVPPATVAQRLAALTPFLVAGRQWPGDPIPQAWRVATLGDPLATLPSPKLLEMVPPRIAAPAPEAGCSDVRAEARAALERTKTADAAAAPAEFRTAMRDLALAGDDAVAAQLWKVAKAKGAGAAVARDALGPLFRAGTRADFMDAWSSASDPTAEQRDMLWQLWTLDIASLRDRAAIAALKSAVRAPRLDMDASALFPAVRSSEGADAAGAWINSLIDRAPDADTKRRLAAIQGAG